MRIVGEHGVMEVDPGYSLALDPADMLRIGRPKSARTFFEVNGQQVKWVRGLSWATMTSMYLWLKYQSNKSIIVAEHRAMADVGWFVLLSSTSDPLSDHNIAIRAASMSEAFMIAYDVYLWSGRSAEMSLDHRIQNIVMREAADEHMGFKPNSAEPDLANANKVQGYAGKSCV